MDALERSAETGIDLTEDIFERFFVSYPEAHSVMGHSDEHMRGRMAEQTFELFMDDRHDDEQGYLSWEVDNHLSAYSVGVEMYPAYLLAIKDAVSASLGDAWQPAHETAWQARIDTLIRKINEYAASRELAL